MEGILVLIIIFFALLIFYIVGETYAYSKENGAKLDKILLLLETDKKENNNSENTKSEIMNDIDESSKSEFTMSDNVDNDK